MKTNLPNHLIGKQVNTCLPMSAITLQPLNAAIRKVFCNTTRTPIMPLLALSLAGLAAPALAQHAVVELSSLDGSNGFVLNGLEAGDRTGHSVSMAGDVNGDGIDDVLIGANEAEPNGFRSGASYVVFGSNEVGASGAVQLSELNGSNGFVINGVGIFDESGFAVSEAGDVNGDGVDDLLIGSYDADIYGRRAGTSYVVFGSSTVASSGTLELSALNGSNGFAISGVALLDRSGYAVSATGDVNSDGIDDLLIGSFGADPNGIDSGATHVVFGARGVGVSGTVELSTLDGSNGFTINGVAADDRSGISVSAAGDVNNDGIKDLLIGASHADPNGIDEAGASYVVFGASGVGASGTVELSELNGSNGFVLNGVAAGDHLGRRLSSAGDVNGDGVDDLIIGAGDADPNGSYSGASYVVFGANGVGAGGTVELSELNGSNGFVLNGQNGPFHAGNAVSSAGDVNNDGIDDLLADRFVVFGDNTVAPGGTVELSSLDGSNSIFINSNLSSVSAAGDVNNDGIDDMLFGYAFADTEGEGSGAAYVVFGQVADDSVRATLDIPVASGSDDAEENTTTGKINRGSSDLELVDQGATNQLVGLRFNGLAIPQGTTITKAFIQFQTDETSSGATTLMIHGQATDNAPTFTNVNANISSRAQTNAVVNWAPAPWVNIGEAGADQHTPNIASIIHEIVTRPGWSSGNSLALMISGAGRRTAESFNGDPAAAPVLHVEYSLGTGNNQAPVTDAGSEQTIILPDSENAITINLDGTVSDDGLPDLSATTIIWNKVSGPGTVSFGDASAEDTTAEFDSVGTYVLRLTADDGALTSFDDITIRVNSEGTPSILEVSVAASDDDAEENTATGKVNRGSSDLELVDQGALKQLIGMRFNALNLPQGSTITKAWIQFQTDETHSGFTQLMIEGEATDDALAFTNTNANLSSRALTAATIDWTPAPWTTVGEAGVAQQTPNIAPIIQEIVERPDWSSGNALVVLISGTGRRNAESYNGDPAGAPVLHVEYQ